MLEQVLARAAFMVGALRRAPRLAAVARDPTVDPRILPLAADTIGSVLTFKCSYLLKIALFFRKREA